MTFEARGQQLDFYEVFDDDGRPVGRVVFPRRMPVRHDRRETVFLDRRRRPPAAADRRRHG